MANSPLTEAQRTNLVKNASLIVAPGKGILAADESNTSVPKKFEKIHIENNEENRRLYRNMFFSASPELSKYIGGIIFFDETFYQKGDNGQLFRDFVKSIGIQVGIKVDKGVKPLEGGAPGETITSGLEDLDERCAKYSKEGAVFTKWRNVIHINVAQGKPSDKAIYENARILAEYAFICQKNNLVPIVEPEVLQDGDHDMHVCQEVTEKVLAAQYKALADHKVFLEGTLLKPNMVTPGQGCPKRATPQEIGIATAETLSRRVPPAVAGIVFLSGGQSEEQATVNLNEINKYKGARKPWPLTFSFGRALQESALMTWAGKPENVKNGQAIFLKRAIANHLAAEGKYTGSGADAGAAGQSLFEAGRVY
ncbi:unnamed protein product [Gordionus sp. m RMFG-2023]|uniref:fructose-bisphosphate aldolase C-like n=1 Tax=Gordionus sp. m RMFG-2023 TaxID=3053472 RepID=UPI0030E3BA8E